MRLSASRYVRDTEAGRGSSRSSLGSWRAARRSSSTATAGRSGRSTGRGASTSSTPWRSPPTARSSSPPGTRSPRPRPSTRPPDGARGPPADRRLDARDEPLPHRQASLPSPRFVSPGAPCDSVLAELSASADLELLEAPDLWQTTLELVDAGICHECAIVSRMRVARSVWPAGTEEAYRARAGRPALVEVPELSYLMLDGEGDPASAAAYVDAVETLYAVAYAARFDLKRSVGIHAKVRPLEGIWWSAVAGDVWSSRDAWRWTMMIAEPAAVTEEVLARALAAAARKRPRASLQRLRLERLGEGRVARCCTSVHTARPSGRPSSFSTPTSPSGVCGGGAATTRSTSTTRGGPIRRIFERSFASRSLASVNSVTTLSEMHG